MTTLIGIAIGAPYRRGIGVCVTTPAGIVQAVTITPDRALGGTEALIDAARRAIAVGIEIATEAGDTHPTWAIEGIPGSRGVTQQQRAAAARADVRATWEARMLIRAVIRSDIPDPRHIVDAPSIGDIPADRCPPVLSGPKPRDWRGARGDRREVQRTAWACAEYARRSIAQGGAA